MKLSRWNHRGRTVISCEWYYYTLSVHNLQQIMQWIRVRSQMLWLTCIADVYMFVWTSVIVVHWDHVWFWIHRFRLLMFVVQCSGIFQNSQWTPLSSTLLIVIHYTFFFFFIIKNIQDKKSFFKNCFYKHLNYFSSRLTWLRRDYNR